MTVYGALGFASLGPVETDPKHTTNDFYSQMLLWENWRKTTLDLSAETSWWSNACTQGEEGQVSRCVLCVCMKCKVKEG